MCMKMSWVTSSASVFLAEHPSNVAIDPIEVELVEPLQRVPVAIAQPLREPRRQLGDQARRRLGRVAAAVSGRLSFAALVDGSSRDAADCDRIPEEKIAVDCRGPAMRPR